MSPDYYDRQGNAISIEEWIRGFEDRGKKRVAKTKIGDSEVSTVWLGLDRAWGDGPPLIFETLVFDGPLDMEMDRYSTEEQALKGHEEMCARVRASLTEEEEG